MILIALLLRCFLQIKGTLLPDSALSTLWAVLRSEIFVSEDRQLRVVHLILDFEPLSNTFQEVGHAIRAGDPRLARIDVLVPGFLA